MLRDVETDSHTLFHQFNSTR